MSEGCFPLCVLPPFLPLSFDHSPSSLSCIPSPSPLLNCAPFSDDKRGLSSKRGSAGTCRCTDSSVTQRYKTDRGAFIIKKKTFLIQSTGWTRPELIWRGIGQAGCRHRLSLCCPFAAIVCESRRRCLHDRRCESKHSFHSERSSTMQRGMCSQLCLLSLMALSLHFLFPYEAFQGQWNCCAASLPCTVMMKSSQSRQPQQEVYSTK